MSASEDPGVAIDCTRTGAMAILAPRGELDLQGARALRCAVEAALTDRPLILALDLRGVTFIDASTVGELVALGGRCAAESRRLLLIRGTPWVDRMLVTCGLPGLFDVIDGLDRIPSGEPLGELPLGPPV